MHEGGDSGLVAGDSELFQPPQRPPDAGAVQARHAHQLIGGDSGIGVRLDERLDDPDEGPGL